MKNTKRLMALLLATSFMIPMVSTVANKVVVNAEESDDNVVVDVPDPNLRQGMCTMLKKDFSEPITRGELRTLKYLSPEQCTAHNQSEYGVKVKTLEGIQYCTNLENLSLAYQKLTDISQLSGLTKLKHLDLRGTINETGEKLTDISALSGLVNLEFLNIRQSAFKNLDKLKNLTKLKELDLNASGVENLDFIENLTALEKLDLGYNKISDISKLEKLVNLKTLNLGATPRTPLNADRKRIENISVLANMKKLEELDLASNDIVDITPLKNLKNLSSLAIQSNKIENFEPVLELPVLKTIWPQGNSTQLNNESENFKTAQTIFDKLKKEELTREDLDTINELINSKPEVKNYFKADSLKKLDSYKAKLENNETVKNDVFVEDVEHLERFNLIEVINPKKIEKTIGEDINSFLPKTVKIKVKKVNTEEKAVGNIVKDTNDCQHFNVAIVNEQGKLVKQPIKFLNWNGKEITSENGFLYLDLRSVIANWSHISVTINDEAYNMVGKFSFMKESVQTVYSINDKEIANLSQEEIGKLLVIKVAPKSANANTENVDSNVDLIEMEAPVVWDTANFKNTVGTHNINGKLTLTGEVTNLDNKMATVEVEVIEDEGQEIYLFTKDNSGKSIKDELKFELVNNDNGEKQDLTSKNGQLSPVLKAGNYTLKLKENSSYEAKDFTFVVENEDGMLEAKVNGELVTEVVLTKKAETPKPEEEKPEENTPVVVINNETVVENTNKNTWEKIDGIWYYRDSAEKDIYRDGWGKIDNVWYRFDKDGKMLSNTWFKDTNGRWYWLESSGAMSENEWIYVDGNWFWAYGNGIIAENEWVYVGDKWYYAKSGGYIVMNQDYTVNGVVYSFDENGAMK